MKGKNKRDRGSERHGKKGRKQIPIKYIQLVISLLTFNTCVCSAHKKILRKKNRQQKQQQQQQEKQQQNKPARV